MVSSGYSGCPGWRGTLFFTSKHFSAMKNWLKSTLQRFNASTLQRFNASTLQR
jgi:hypothetical protein